MIDRTRVSRGVLCALLGYVIPLPLVGRLFHWRAVLLLKEERGELALLQPLLLLMTAADVERVALLLGTGGILADLSRQVPFLRLLAVSAELYFHYQFLGDLSLLAEVYQRGREREDHGQWRRPLMLLMSPAVAAYVLELFFELTMGVRLLTRLLWALATILLLYIYRQPSGDLGGQIRGRRTMYILLVTAIFLMNYIPDGGLFTLLFQGAAVILNAFVVLYIALGLYQLWWCSRTLAKT